MKSQFTGLLMSCLVLSGHFAFSHGVCIIDGSAGIYLHLQSATVDVRVNNQIAVVTATQTFTNTTGTKQPFRYGFPLHPNANATALKWFINGQWHNTIISSNEQTDSIPGSGGNPLDQDLIQYLGTNAILVTPDDSIGIDSSVTFIMTYVELLPYEFGVVRFHYPNDYSRIQPHTVVESNAFHFSLQSDRTIEDVGIETFAADISLTPNSSAISLQEFEVIPVTDYHVYYQLSSTELGVIKLSTYIPDSLLYCDESGQGYLSLIIEPESNANTEVIEKNFSLIIDRSGSMTGTKIAQARNAAAFIVNHLNAGDYFNIIDFSSHVTSLFPDMVPFNIPNRDAALAHINSITAGGSTNISGALTTSISDFQALDTNKANIIIFFTDGMATAGITDDAGILQAITQATNVAETSIYLFTFGIGSDVDKSLLTRMAIENGGLAAFLGNDELEEKITEFFLKINNPVLLHTQFWFEPDIITDVYPSPLPNLYKGQQLILSGRYAEPAPVTLHLSGKAFNLPVAYTFPIDLADTNDVEKSFLPKIWAKQIIDHHTISYNLADSEDEKEELQSLIDTLSICYGVISTQFTSFEDGGVTAIEFDEKELTDSGIRITITPNPFIDHFTLRILSRVSLASDGQLILVNALGIPVFRMALPFIDQDGEISVKLPADLPPGVYYVVLQFDSEVVIREVIRL